MYWFEFLGSTYLSILSLTRPELDFPIYVRSLQVRFWAWNPVTYHHSDSTVRVLPPTVNVNILPTTGPNPKNLTRFPPFRIYVWRRNFGLAQSRYFKIVQTWNLISNLISNFLTPGDSIQFRQNAPLYIVWLFPLMTQHNNRRITHLMQHNSTTSKLKGLIRNVIFWRVIWDSQEHMLEHQKTLISNQR